MASQSRSPRHLLSTNYRRQKTASSSLRLDQPQTPLAARSRSDQQDQKHAPLSANFPRSQGDRCYPQRSTLHRCPTHASHSSTNSRGRIDAIHEKSLQTENILKVSSTERDCACPMDGRVCGQAICLAALSARRTGCAKERSSGSVRGALSDGRPYRDRQASDGSCLASQAGPLFGAVKGARTQHFQRRTGWSIV